MANTPPIPGTSAARFPKAPAKTPSRGNFSRPPGGEQFRDIKGRFAGGFAVNWIGLDAIIKATEEMSGLDQYFNALEFAEKIKAYAKENAPWEDRTTDAREGLDTDVVPSGDEISIFLFHTVEYGVYLENANGGNFAIIIPTMEKFAQELQTTMFGPGTK